MITETRQSRTRLLQYEYHRRQRRRHHTLDNTTLDKFNFVCVPLHPDESRFDSSSLRSHSTKAQRTDYSGSTSSTQSYPAAARRVRFKCDENGIHRNTINLPAHRPTHSSEDVRLAEKNSTHRVEFRIPIHKDINPWLNVDCSVRPKTRSLTSQKIDIRHSNHNFMHPHGIAPYVRTEMTSQPSSMGDSNQTQLQWYRQMYNNIHKSPGSKLDYQRNPYKPTYTFPDDYNGDSDLMEDYIRKTATKTIDKDNQNAPFSPVRTLTSSLKDHRTPSKRNHNRIEKVTRFEDQVTSPGHSSSVERHRSDNHHPSTNVSSSMKINLQSNSNHSSASDNEQKLTSKRTLYANDVPTNHLPKHDRDKPSNHKNGQTDQQSWVSRHDVGNGNQQKIQSKTSVQTTSQPICKALALHSFYAQTSRELSFKKGDLLLVRRRINDDWLEGEFQDSVGIFPLNHVELFPLEINEQENLSSDYDMEHEAEGEAIVKYDFIPQKSFELQLRKGDKVVLLRRLDENWYEGRLNHIEGIFPAAYVETLKEPPVDNLLQQSQPIEQVQSPKPVSSDSEPASSEKVQAIPDKSLPMRKCQVLYDYTPQNPDELEIHVGDIINIIEMCDDGWYCGVMDRPNQRDSMEFGTFPGNYVKLLS